MTPVSPESVNEEVALQKHRWGIWFETSTILTLPSMSLLCIIINGKIFSNDRSPSVFLFRVNGRSQSFYLHDVRVSHPYGLSGP